MQAPLGRAVIGGLVMSTFATLLVVPSFFALVIGSKKHRSPSVYPDDRESAYYDPEALRDQSEGEDTDGDQSDNDQSEGEHEHDDQQDSDAAPSGSSESARERKGET
jgi:hypothetical protein